MNKSTLTGAGIVTIALMGGGYSIFSREDISRENIQETKEQPASDRLIHKNQRTIHGVLKEIHMPSPMSIEHASPMPGRMTIHTPLLEREKYSQVHTQESIRANLHTLEEIEFYSSEAEKIHQFLEKESEIRTRIKDTPWWKDYENDRVHPEKIYEILQQYKKLSSFQKNFPQEFEKLKNIPYDETTGEGESTEGVLREIGFINTYAEALRIFHENQAFRECAEKFGINIENLLFEKQDSEFWNNFYALLTIEGDTFSPETKEIFFRSEGGKAYTSGSISPLDAQFLLQEIERNQ